MPIMDRALELTVEDLEGVPWVPWNSSFKGYIATICNVPLYSFRRKFAYQKGWNIWFTLKGNEEEYCKAMFEASNNFHVTYCSAESCGVCICIGKQCIHLPSVASSDASKD